MREVAVVTSFRLLLAAACGLSLAPDAWATPAPRELPMTWSARQPGGGRGRSPMQAITLNGVPHVSYLDEDRMWMLLQDDGQGGARVVRWATLPDIGAAMAVGDVLGGGDAEVVIHTVHDVVLVLDPASGAVITSFPSPIYAFIGMDTGDLEGDGVEEIFVATHTPHPYDAEVLVYRGDGTLVTSLTYPFAYSFTVADLDGDLVSEVITETGILDPVLGLELDLSSHQFVWASVADVDGDGQLEVIGENTVRTVIDPAGVDPDMVLPWSGLYGRGTAAGNIDADPEDELMAWTFTGVDIFDVTTNSVIYSLSMPKSSQLAPEMIDLDGDGWDEGWVDVGQLHRISPQGVETWVSDAFGEFMGPKLGDLDGDGVLEAVILATDLFVPPTAILVMDPQTRAMKGRWFLETAAGEPLPAWDFDVADMDGDGTDEVLTNSPNNYGTSVWQYWSWTPGGGAVLDFESTQSTGWFDSIRAVDVYNDGSMDVLAGFGAVYDATGALIWYDSSWSVWGDASCETGDLDRDGDEDGACVATTTFFAIGDLTALRVAWAQRGYWESLSIGVFPGGSRVLVADEHDYLLVDFPSGLRPRSLATGSMISPLYPAAFQPPTGGDSLRAVKLVAPDWAILSLGRGFLVENVRTDQYIAWGAYARGTQGAEPLLIPSSREIFTVDGGGPIVFQY